MPYFALPFAIGTFLLGCIFCAVFVTVVSQDTALYYKRFTCGILTNTGTEMKPATGVAKTMNVNFIDHIMCSNICPCEPEGEELWKEKYTEAELKYRKRTWEA